MDHLCFSSRYKQKSRCKAVFSLRMTDAVEMTSFSAVNDFYSCILSLRPPVSPRPERRPSSKATVSV